MRFILLAHQRTGTTVFRSLVNQHPKLYLYNEAFFPSMFKWGWYAYLSARLQEDPNLLLPARAGREVVPYLDWLAERKEKKGKKVVGVDLKIPQAELIRDLHKQVKSAGYGILHLRRRNTLAAIVSYRTMTARKREGKPVHGSETSENEMITLDMEWLALRMQAYENQDRQANWTHRTGKYLEIFYEDFTSPEGWRATCPQLAEFFGMKFDVDFSTPLKKQNSSNLMDLIRNADEVRAAYPQFF